MLAVGERPATMTSRSDYRRPARVCVDLSLCEMYDRHGGIARYGANLLRELTRLPDVDPERIAFYGMTEAHRPPKPAEAALAWASDPGPEIGLRRHRFRRRWRMPGLLERAGIDLLHAVDPNLLPIRVDLPVVATCHDVIEIVLRPADRSDRRHARMRAEEARRYACASHVVADTENTRRDAIRELGIPPDRISVVHLGVRAEAFARDDATTGGPARSLPDRYFVSVGSDFHRKNQLGLAEAWASVADRIPEGLVLVGRALYDDTFQRLEREMQARGLGSRFVWLQDVEDAELPGLYHGATAAIAPSLYEGFGLTILEAMAAGTPVVACRNGAYDEVGGDAALYFDGTSAESIADRLVRVSGDEACRKELVRAGARRVQAFTWRATAEATWRVYARVLGI